MPAEKGSMHWERSSPELTARFEAVTDGVDGIARKKMFGEIAGSDWCAVYMRRVMHSANATAAATYTVFALAMATSRLTGDRVINRFGATRTVRWSALAGVVGGVLIVTVRSEPVVVLRRACDIGMGRGMDLDGFDRADELRDQQAGICYTMQPEIMTGARREVGAIRDFADHADALLARDEEG